MKKTCKNSIKKELFSGLERSLVNIAFSPRCHTWANFHRLRITLNFDTSPPCGFADRKNCQNVRQTHKA
jgi:hypothetical protein